MKKVITFTILLTLASFAVLNWTLSSQAEVITNIIEVTTTTDNMSNDSLCSLREAVYNVNTEGFYSPAVGECTAGSSTLLNVIRLQSGETYNLTIPGTEDNQGDLDLHNDVRIEVTGGAAPASIVMGLANERVVEVHAGVTAELVDINLQNNFISGAGGGIFNSGHLTLTQVSLQSNVAWAGGGLYNDVKATAVFNSGQVVLNTANELFGGGGIVNLGTLSLTDVIVRANNTIMGGGGGIHNSGGHLTIHNSAVNLNDTDGSGGGLLNSDGGTIIITGTGSSVDGNMAANDGGGIYNIEDSHITINSGVTVNGNEAINHGGGIYSESTVILDQVIVAENIAQRGAGLANNGGTLDIIDSQILDNVAGSLDMSYGGGVYHFGGGIMMMSGTAVHNNEAILGYGAGVAIADTNTTVTIIRSSITHNEAGLGGGGIWTDATLTLANSTISSNGTQGDGSGLYIDLPNGNVVATNVTIANNMPGVDLYKLGQLTLQNSIISNLAQTNCIGSLDFPLINSLGNNLADDGDGNSCWAPTATDIIDPETLLSPLADNGGNTLPHGNTWTHALEAGSPALGHGNAAACAAAPVSGVDQRGLPRPAASCDSGAYQTQIYLLYLPMVTSQ